MSDCKKCKPPAPFVALFERMTENKLSFTIYILCHALILLTAARGAVSGVSRTVSVALLALALMQIPLAVKLLLRIRLSTALESLSYLFVLGAQILGEVHHFYSRFPVWDSVLHWLSGFMFAAFGFCLVDLFHKNRAAVRRVLSPLFIALVAFLFSVTVGVIWEFVEFGGDRLLGKDMQKDTLLHDIYTIHLRHISEDAAPDTPVHSLNDIQRMELYDSMGELIAATDGYLDIGLTDTVKDMAMNCLGATAFCGLGYYALKTKKHTHFASFFIPTQHTACDGTEASDPERSNDTAEVSTPTD